MRTLSGAAADLIYQIHKHYYKLSIIGFEL
jgi:hypothetical protein